jgi:hypothetical protein
MLPPDSAPSAPPPPVPASRPLTPPLESRLDTLERTVAALSAELAAVRAELGPIRAESLTASGPPPRPPVASRPLPVPRVPSEPPRSSAPRRLDPRQIEGLVGRYGMLAIAVGAAVAAVGTFLSWAIARGYLTLNPPARVLFGVAFAGAIGAWGLKLRRTEQSFGSSMMGLAMVIVQVCAYAAGPSFHLVPTSVAFIGAAAVSWALAIFAHAANDEPLWCVAFGGAALAPFVTTDGHANVFAVVIYALLVLIPACFAISHREWPIGWRVFYAVSGLFVIAGASQARTAGLAGYIAVFALPFVIAGAGIIPFAPSTRKRGALRWLGCLGLLASLAVSGDTRVTTVFGAILVVALGLWIAIVDRNAGERKSSILARGREQPILLDWADAAVIPLLLMIQAANLLETLPAAATACVVGAALLAAFAWRRPVSPARDAAAFAAVAAAVGAMNFLPLETPTGRIAAFLALGLASLALHKLRPSRSWLLMGGTLLVTAATLCVTALTGRIIYQYTPFATEPSAAALLVTLALVIVARFWAWVREATRASIPDRPEWTYAHRLRFLVRGVTVAPWCWAFIWVMLELSMAYGASTATLLLVTYFAATAVACVGAGQMKRSARLRQTGLVLAIGAAATACLGATSYFGPAARIAAYLVTSAFLLGIAYWYRRPGAATA